MLKTVFNQKFNENIVGITYNPHTKDIFMGLTKKTGGIYYDSEIWSLNLDFSLKKLYFKDPLGLRSIKGIAIKGIDIENVCILYNNRKYEKTVSVGSKGEYRELEQKVKSERVNFNNLSKFSLSNEKDPCLILYGYGAKVLCGESQKLLSEIIELTDKKRLSVITSLEEFHKFDPNLPDLLIVRGTNKVEGYKHGKKIFSHNYKSLLQKFMGIGYTSDAINRYNKNEFYTLLISIGNGPFDLKMIKNFQLYWTLNYNKGPAQLFDINSDGVEELICLGSSLSGGHSVNIYSQIFDSKPTLLEKKKSNFFTGLFIEDVNGDGIPEIVTFSNHELTVYQYSD